MAVKAKVEVHQLASKLAWKAASWSLIYLWGHLSFSPGWLALPLLLSVMRYRQKQKGKERLANGQAFARGPEREVVEARFKELPAWVFFPDVERVEWVNRVIAQLWPSISKFLTTEVEPEIQANLVEQKSQFQLNHVRLGQIPPRLGGVKCYEGQTGRDEIILDLDVIWAGESEIEVSIGGMLASVKDLYFHGSLRVVLKPLLQKLPLVGGVEVYFLQKPAIDFGLGGVAMTAELPGISTLFRKLLMEQIEKRVVFPNKHIITLSDEVPMQVFKCPQVAGVLRITLVEARNLVSKDFDGTSDPYCKLSVDDQQWKSKVIGSTLQPVWNESWEVVVESGKHPIIEQTLALQMWDQDTFGADEVMGSASLPLSSLTGTGKTDRWVALENVKSGEVRIRSLWMPLVPRREGTRTVLQVFVESCHLLPSTPDHQPNPHVELFVAEGDVQKTMPVDGNRYRTALKE